MGKKIVNKELFFKSLSYRFYGFAVAFLTAFIVTGNIADSMGIGLLESVVKIFTYYGYEIFWKKYFGKKYKNSVVWLTGLSGSGKTTVGKSLFDRLQKEGKSVMILDGDEIREIFQNKGFDKASRDEHVRNVGRMAAFLQKRGTTCIVSLISPYRDIRDECRKIAGDFVEVYVSTPLSICEQRDVKGLYKKARAGEIKQFTGIHDDAPYEAPLNPEINLDTTTRTLDDCVEQIIKKIKI